LQAWKNKQAGATALIAAGVALLGGSVIRMVGWLIGKIAGGA
jgi:hypothetical protein